ncbi:hypothetical protein [Stenotrophomonas sp.]|uniref:hypothetical protein n=1 Tax=Stenotrophomonas sp. TaxID=69392 RepID=UPI002898A6F8|nr:hypothetical protein [Stenotrophomonas sp.]
MNSPDIRGLLERSRDILPNDVTAQRVFDFVVGNMESMGSNLDSFRIGDVLSHLGLKGQEESHHAAFALDALSIGPDALLERRFEYWPEDDDADLSDPLPVEPTDMRDALENEFFLDPRTGRRVPNFKDLISVIYVPSHRSRELLERRS